MKDKTNRYGLIIILFLILGIIFRLFNFRAGFLFAHDQDLYSWIARDILVNHHQRLVGQITSVDGVFIGSFYYYLMAFFYWIFGMNPLSAVVPLALMAAGNIYSIYWVVKKHFGLKPGLMAAFIYAVSFGIAKFDRWSVPTLPTLAWSIWFIEVNLEMIKGKLEWLPLYGFLVGFVWQLHIALLPIVPLPIIAYFLGKNNLNVLWSKKYLRTVIAAILVFGITISPFLIFEIKHDFSQIKSMAASTQKDIGAPTGKMKLLKVIEAASRETQIRILYDFKIRQTDWFGLAWILLGGYLIFRKKISPVQALVWGLWLLLIFLAQFVSKRVVSEYYFTNIIPIFVIILALFVSDIFSQKLAFILGLLYLGFNLNWLINKSDEDQGYLYREQVVNYIKNDVVKNNYPCAAANFISDPGVGVGFRYLFWYNKIRLVKPETAGAPVYNIPIPWQLSMEENPVHYGRFGVLLPRPVKGKITEAECNDPKNQLDPLLGYTE